MLKVDQYEYIRTAHRVYGKNVSEIARETGHSRNTVKKVLRGEFTGYSPRKIQPSPVLGPYHEIIYRWLKEDIESPKKQRHTAKRIYTRLVSEYGFTGSETTVRRHVSSVKRSLGLKSSEAFVPLEPSPRGEAEVDWGSATVFLGGEAVRVKIFCMRSKYSGNPFVRLYPCERQQAFFDGLSRGFLYYGGVFPVMIFDNLTAAVEKVLLGKERKEQASFVRFRSWYTFESRFCSPGRGNEKGGVEGLVGFARRNFLVPLPRGESLESINDRLLEECIAYGSHRMTGREGSIRELHDAEKRILIPLPRHPYGNEQTVSVKADKYATVMVDKNRYSVPAAYAGRPLRALLTVDEVALYSGEKRLAVHGRKYGNNHWVLEADHYLELLRERPGAFRDARPLSEWKKTWSDSLNSLLEQFQARQGENRGIKEFIDVLLLARRYGQKRVEAAASQALKNGLSDAAGIRHLLESAERQEETPTSLESERWTVLPAADVSVYSVLEAGR
ncbi:IS21 family transposase [Aminiphilus circumscriptus]|jgi:transposase|uniref:IS21 family transposase n=1 Tax=Aminiphilus circumscriptus TaxID=290732 RepID=UPI0004924BA4|nr:IS21 family transposase [Aminiphilus circumscriptus]